MTSVMRLTLKAGDKVYINGAVLQCDRKVSLQLLNDATFLLGRHMLQPEDAKTPLRQLYFVVQTLLIDPAGEGDVLKLFGKMMASLRESFENEDILAALDEVGEMVGAGRAYAALKTLRGLFALEELILMQRAALGDGLRDKGEKVDGHSGD